MGRTTPWLWFDTEAEEAARFWCGVFPNSRVTGTTHYGPGTGRPEGSVMTVSFELDGDPFVALNGGPEFQFSEAVSFQIACEGQEEVDRFWDRLTDGGQESQCGWLKDRYGVSWQVVPTELSALLSDPDPDRARRATEAMLRMRRIDLTALRRAADGG